MGGVSSKCSVYVGEIIMSVNVVLKFRASDPTVMPTSLGIRESFGRLCFKRLTVLGPSVMQVEPTYL